MKFNRFKTNFDDLQRSIRTKFSLKEDWPIKELVLNTGEIIDDVSLLEPFDRLVVVMQGRRDDPDTRID